MRRLTVNQPSIFKEKGPLLIACNHPNSFLDAVLLATYFDRPVYSLARGDAFKNKHIARLLQALRILPVYRVSEGVENLSSNYETFNACKKILRKGGIILIFSEGLCINEWHLRPLKKGTARLAFSAWDDDIPLRILPAGINYSSFRRFGKNVFINFGSFIQSHELPLSANDGTRYQSFNKRLQQEMEQLVFEIPKHDYSAQQKKLALPVSPWKKWLLFIPAAAGWLLHIPVSFYPKRLVWKYTSQNDHYDSAVAALFILLYLPYVTLLTVISLLIFKSWWALLLLPFTMFAGWSYLQLKPQMKQQ